MKKIETSRFVFAQSPYFSSWVSKSNLDGAQEHEHNKDFSSRVLDKIIIWILFLSSIKLYCINDFLVFTSKA